MCFVNRPGQFVASQLRKRKVEVSVKDVSPDELRQLEQARQNEIRWYLQNEVMEALKGNEEIRDDKLMGLRWVVTVRQLTEKKVKARLVILGYQAGDVEDGLLEAATPAPTRRAKPCFLQVAAHPGLDHTCRERSCKDWSNRRTGAWCQSTSLLTRWGSREEHQHVCAKLVMAW